MPPFVRRPRRGLIARMRAHNRLDMACCEAVFELGQAMRASLISSRRVDLRRVRDLRQHDASMSDGRRRVEEAWLRYREAYGAYAHSAWRLTHGRVPVPASQRYDTPLPDADAWTDALRTNDLYQ